ncbi:hypothetical protein ABZX92_04925 [Lentzea sp. NPDC006480]|uniref:hypothetical protein n=1 Tax=Lentzea sp. NPDC006480 TaxID=3157176 RepID=UPI0033A710C8
MRLKKNGRRCARRSADWGEPDPADPAPDPVACWSHLTPREREIALTNRERGPSAEPPRPRRPRRLTAGAPSHELRTSLNKAAFVLAKETKRHPGSVNRELNDLMGVERRAEATTDQLHEALQYAGDRLRALHKRQRAPAGQESTHEEFDFTSSGDPPF